MRLERKLTAAHKAKIAQSMTGTTLSEATKKKISDSMRRYWSGIPYERRDNETAK